MAKVHSPWDHFRYAGMVNSYRFSPRSFPNDFDVQRNHIICSVLFRYLSPMVLTVSANLDGFVSRSQVSAVNKVEQELDAFMHL